jgi:hypothetical protein
MAVMLGNMGRFVYTSVVSIASVRREYLLQIGFAFITFILTNIVAIGLPNVMLYFKS